MTVRQFKKVYNKMFEIMPRLWYNETAPRLFSNERSIIMSKKVISTKRKDKKGRILRDGECQRKDGQYQYNYTDVDGKRKCVYSWKLEKTDALPKGKRDCDSLREKEQEIQCKKNDGINTDGGKITVFEQAKKYVSLKIGVRNSTKTGYKTVLNFLETNEFGSRRIDKVKPSDAKQWLKELQEKGGKGYSSLHTVKGVLRPAFQMAVEDDYIKRNPFDFRLTDAVINDSEKRAFLSPEQEQKFLEFIRTDKHYSKYYDGIYILLYTGLRISEFCGLTINDVDLEDKTVRVERQLLRGDDMSLIIEQPKTEAGKREIYLTDEVCKCFKRIIDNRRKLRKEPVIPDANGKPVMGFLFIDKNGKPKVALHWENYFVSIRNKYNKLHKDKLPKISPHVCRHTYCTRYANSGMDLKSLQSLMGHTDVRVTMNVYTHVDRDNVRKEVERIEKARLSENTTAFTTNAVVN